MHFGMEVFKRLTKFTPKTTLITTNSICWLLIIQQRVGENKKETESARQRTRKNKVLLKYNQIPNVPSRPVI